MAHQWRSQKEAVGQLPVGVDHNFADSSDSSYGMHYLLTYAYYLTKQFSVTDVKNTYLKL